MRFFYLRLVYGRKNGKSRFPKSRKSATAKMPKIGKNGVFNHILPYFWPISQPAGSS